MSSLQLVYVLPLYLSFLSIGEQFAWGSYYNLNVFLSYAFFNYSLCSTD